MKTNQLNNGIVDAAIADGRGSFQFATAANVCGVLGLVFVFRAVGALIGSDLHPAEGASTQKWLLVGLVGLLCQVMFSALGAHLAARGAGRVEHTMRHRLHKELFRSGAPVVSAVVATRILLEGARGVADASERWEPIRRALRSTQRASLCFRHGMICRRKTCAILR